MLRPLAFIPSTFRVCALIVFLVKLATGTPSMTSGAVRYAARSDNPTATVGSDAADMLSYQWNLDDKNSPLLSLQGDHLKPGLDRSLTYRFEQLRFPVFQALTYDEERGRYVLPSFATDGSSHFVEFQLTEVKNTYSAIEAGNVRLIDNDNIKTIRTSDGTKYVFVRYPDGEFRCATIKEASGASLNLLYTANGLMLHGVVDSVGRSVTFNYGSAGISSVTQTWMANLEGFTRTWPMGDAPQPSDPDVKYSHALGLKALPANAVVRQYTSEMAASDKLLASIFGGPNAVAGGNGFEPAGLGASYPLYRGDVFGDDGIQRRGHLSFAMHLYGSPNGTGDSPLYVPGGFVAHSSQPSPTDAVVTFYYPRLGNLTDVTLAVFHVADFQINDEGQRVRIGNLGGPGGSSPLYKHSHVEFYRGNTGLPPISVRASLRIDPAKVFSLANESK
jgi:hypothetical protein